MSIVLQSSGGGSVTILEPATASNFTATLPAVTGTLVVSGTTPTLNGITFPATQVPSANANTLDDYEEGTFTPTFSPSSGSWTTSSVTGRYVKVGQAVTVFASLRITLVGSGSGGISFGSFPFVAFNPAIGAGNRAAVGMVREDAVTGVISQGIINGGTVNGQWQSLTGGAVAQGNDYLFEFCLQYISAD